MLLKLLPDQIAKYWDYIKYTVANSFQESVPLSDRMLENALENLLTDTLQCWWLVTNSEDETKLHCIMITGSFYDNVTRENTLRICYLFGFLDMSEELWREAGLTIMKYAQAKGFTGIDAITDNPAVLRIAEMYKANVRNYVYLRLENGHG